MRRHVRGQGDIPVATTGVALAVSILLIGGLVGVVSVSSLAAFWPRDLRLLTLDDGTRILGELVVRERIPGTGAERWNLKVGNRGTYDIDFRWVDAAHIVSFETPADALRIERREYGNFHGGIAALREGDRTIAEGQEEVLAILPQWLARARADRKAVEVEEKRIGAIDTRIEALRLEARKLDLREEDGKRVAPGDRDRIAAETARLREEFDAASARLEETSARAAAPVLDLRTVEGTARELPLRDVIRLARPNALGLAGKLRFALGKIREFLSAAPRESNTEGGVLPAIFGTVLMVLLMSIAVVPLGVITAVYLNEYARPGPLVRLVRLAVSNLAGVPSIVFGVFGLGFFVYVLGGSIDRFFFPERLPTPTFGTGGILWASLTLALLTVPVVVVATEEGLASVPRGIREGSLALGATKWATIRRIVLPGAAPGILTGIILAVARGAGEVAPLMITGVVKLAPSLPVDGAPPFLHLDRKFMHLGFHIYDVGFQSPNVEAAKPMVYATTLLLLILVIVLNLTAIQLRNRLRRRHSTSGV